MIDFSVESVTFLSPATCVPPSSESLPLTLSLELTVSSPPPSEQLVRAGISDHLVVIPLTLEGVAARAPFYDVVTTGSVHGIVAPQTADDIRARGAVECVCSRSA